MKEYVITEKAGRFVAGQRNPGVGISLHLTDKAAEAGLREGALVLKKNEADAPAEKAQAGQAATKTQPKKAD